MKAFRAVTTSFTLLTLVFLFTLAPGLASCADGDAATPDPPSPASIVPDTDSPEDAASTADVSASPGDVAAGASLVLQSGCGACHQSTLPADGILSGRKVALPGTSAFPANLTPDVATGLGGWTDDQVIAAIRTGSDTDGTTLCESMPRYSFADDDAHAVVAYLRSLPPMTHDIPDSVCDDDGDPADAGDAGITAISDASLDAPFDAASCDSWAGPSVVALCHSCLTAPCQKNGCFNGWWCDTATLGCHPSPPAACGSDP